MTISGRPPDPQQKLNKTLLSTGQTVTDPERRRVCGQNPSIKLRIQERGRRNVALDAVNAADHLKSAILGACSGVVRLVELHEENVPS